MPRRHSEQNVGVFFVLQQCRPFTICLIYLVNYLLFNRFDGVRGYSMPQTEEQRLVRYLTANYSRLGKPGMIHSNALIVQARFFPIKLQNLLEKEEALQMTVRIQLNWKDPALQFDPSMFHNQTSVILPGGSIWIPDLQISNSMSDLYGLLRDPRFDFKVYSDGTVWWHPTGNIATRCEIMLAYFPFDYQRCPIVMESVIYTHTQLNLTLRYDKTSWSKSMYAESGHWDLIAIKARSRLKYVTNSTAFTSVEFWIFLGRKSGYYKLNIIFPCGMLSALQMLTFFLPLESSERVPEATTILLSVIVFQSMIIQDLPRSSDALPLLCVYIDLLTGISVISVGEAVLIAYLVSRKMERRFCPQWAIPLLKCLYRLRNRDPVRASSLRSVDSDNMLTRYNSYRGGNRRNNNYIDYPPHGEPDFFADPHSQHRQHCVWCHDSDYHRHSHSGATFPNEYARTGCPGAVDGASFGLVPMGNNLRHRESATRRSRDDLNPQQRALSNAETIAYLKSGGNRPNGALPCESKDAVSKDVVDNNNNESQEKQNTQLSENLKQIAGRGAARLPRVPSRSSSSRLRPLVLAPLARLDSYDYDSSDYDLMSENNFAGTPVNAVPFANAAEVNEQQLTAATTSFTSTVVENETAKAMSPNEKAPSLTEDLKGIHVTYSNKDATRNINDDNEMGAMSPYSSVRRKRRQDGKREERRFSRRNLSSPMLLVDWVFLAKVVDYVAFVCCLFAITGVPIFLFVIVPPDFPDYNLDNH